MRQTVALTCAGAPETLHMGDIVETMLPPDDDGAS